MEEAASSDSEGSSSYCSSEADSAEAVFDALAAAAEANRVFKERDPAAEATLPEDHIVAAFNKAVDNKYYSYDKSSSPECKRART